MTVKDKKMEDTKTKKEVFDLIQKISHQQVEIFKMTQEQKKMAGLDMDTPNIATTLNNKLVQLQHEFEESGISIYSNELVGNAVILDLFEYARKGVENSANYQKTSDSIIKKKQNRDCKFKHGSFLVRLAKIKNFFMPIREEDLLYTQEEKQVISQYILDSIDIDKQLWNYNLRNHIVDSIVKEMKRQNYTAHEVQKLIEESVIPDLQKLGLDDLTPELKTALRGEKNKSGSLEELIQEIQVTAKGIQKNVATIEKHLEGREK